MKLFSQNGCGPTIIKAAILGLAHDPDKKLMEKYKKGRIVGLGPSKTPNWTGLNLVSDLFNWSQFCHVGSDVALADSQ